jgi:hypothetical protein
MTGKQMNPTPPKFEDFCCDLAPGLKPWQSLGSRVARLTNLFPALAPRIFCAPVAAFHTYAIYLIFHNGTKDSVETARLIYTTDPRKLLHTCLPGADDRLFGILSKCPPFVQTPIFYERLLSLFDHADIADELLASDMIDKEAVAFFVQVKRHHLDALIIPARHKLNHKIKSALVFHDLLQVCRSLRVIRDDGTEISTLQKSKKTLSEVIDVWLDRCVSPHNLQLCAPSRFIRTAHDLNTIAGKHKNCLSAPKYKIALGTGTHIFILLRERGFEIVSSLEAGPGSSWWIDECVYGDNFSAGRVVRERLADLLRKCNLKVGIRNFQQSWSELGRSDDMPHINDLWDGQRLLENGIRNNEPDAGSQFDRD